MSFKPKDPKTQVRWYNDFFISFVPLYLNSLFLNITVFYIKVRRVRTELILYTKNYSWYDELIKVRLRKSFGTYSPSGKVVYKYVL